MMIFISSIFVGGKNQQFTRASFQFKSLMDDVYQYIFC